MDRFAEKKESLWVLAVSPTIWTVYFLLCYITAAIWCAKFAGRDASLSPVRIAMGFYTVAALAGIAYNGWQGYCRHKAGDKPLPHGDDTSEDRHRFLGFATLLLAGLSAIATVYVALVAIFIKTCD